MFITRKHLDSLNERISMLEKKVKDVEKNQEKQEEIILPRAGSKDRPVVRSRNISISELVSSAYFGRPPDRSSTVTVTELVRQIAETLGLQWDSARPGRIVVGKKAK